MEHPRSALSCRCGNHTSLHMLTHAISCAILYITMTHVRSSSSFHQSLTRFMNGRLRRTISLISLLSRGIGDKSVKTFQYLGTSLSLACPINSEPSWLRPRVAVTQYDPHSFYSRELKLESCVFPLILPIQSFYPKGPGAH